MKQVLLTPAGVGWFRDKYGILRQDTLELLRGPLSIVDVRTHPHPYHLVQIPGRKAEYIVPDAYVTTVPRLTYGQLLDHFARLGFETKPSMILDTMRHPDGRMVFLSSVALTRWRQIQP